MFDEKIVLCAEIKLSKYFTAYKAEGEIPAKDILTEIKTTFPCIAPVGD